MSLPAPAIYTPWRKGAYEVAPNLRPLGTDFGNGELDQKILQVDSERERYLENKRQAVAESKEKYFVRGDLPAGVEAAACELLSRELGVPNPNSLDELLMHCQEDLAIVIDDGEQDRIAYLSVCAPSHWTPREKLGLSFFDSHQVVPGMERVTRAARGMVDAMIRRGPWVRFVWGVETDNRLNHHPDPPLGEDPVIWNGRLFNSQPFWVRVERQVIYGLPDLDAALFFIRVGFVSAEAVLMDPELKASLVQALHSMSPEARAYKGVDLEFDGLMRQLA